MNQQTSKNKVEFEIWAAAVKKQMLSALQKKGRNLSSDLPLEIEVRKSVSHHSS